MTLQDIRTLLAYDLWATDLQFKTIEGLAEPDYHKDLGSSMGGLHGTLVHIYAAQRIWLSRWRGESPTSLASPAEIPSLAELRKRWAELRDQMGVWISGLSEEKLQAHLTYHDLKGNRHSQPLVHQVQHVMNHSTYHRGQVTTLLRQLGTVPPSTDLIIYYRQH